MSFRNKPIQQWSTENVKQWILSLNRINGQQKQNINEAVDNESVTGDDLYDASKEDLESCLDVNGVIANRLLNAIDIIKQQMFDNVVGDGVNNNNQNCANANNNNNNNITNQYNGTEGSFTVNLQGQKGSIVRLDNMYKHYTVERLKKEYLQKFGHEITQTKYKGLDMTYLGKHLENHKTLEYYNIVSHLCLIIVVFKVNGGSQLKQNNKLYKASDSTHPRKLRLKKYPTLKLSKKPDCIMHYTDKDNIKRAEMECGHAIASDSMYRYMKSIFDKNMRAIKIVCPIPTCHKEWKWHHVVTVADLTETEYIKYTQILSLRRGGLKACPNCGTRCQRPNVVRIWRVRCTFCHQKDWCWECERPWKGSGLSICGNNNCIAQKLNKELRYSWNNEMVTPQNWSPKVTVPRLRACPECLTLLSYVEECKHITCLACPHQYCHVCLKKWPTCTSETCSRRSVQQF